MQRYEYKVVPAPKKGTKAKGVKTPEGRFSLTIEHVLNEMGAEGWEYQRAELLPSEERVGLTGSTTNWRNVLVFRRAVETEVPDNEAVAFLTPPDADDTPLARPIPGPETSAPDEQVTAPARIAQEHDDPPLTLKPAPEAPEPEADSKPDKTKQDS
ncbi:conserved hypothetical protein [Ruegeria lacuscaerulensis ITI-1157]|nr:conserved hypothetical protein [Ruegeria lacuscaerulensis ITI-1157]SHI50373.1 protein of unknown function [Ruegeria lacuscaerulensis ITI-1157]